MAFHVALDNTIVVNEISKYHLLSLLNIIDAIYSFPYLPLVL